MNRQFLKEYLKDIRSVGAVAPSSRYLARKMVESIDFTHTKVIVEYGAGTGVFTAEITKRMQPGTTLLVFETNPAFYEHLYKKYKNQRGVEVVQESAEQVDVLRKERSLPAPDYIVSGLPFAALPAETSKNILATTAKLLGKKGEFITFQYTLLKKGLLESYFGEVHVTRELRNVPPAYILHCK